MVSYASSVFSVLLYEDSDTFGIFSSRKKEQISNLKILMKIETAIQKLSNLGGESLREFADDYNITIFSKNGGYNKGWPGQVVERYLGGTIDSSKEPDFGSWELKVTSVEFKKR